MLFPWDHPSSPDSTSLCVSFLMCLVEQQYMPQKAADVAGGGGGGQARVWKVRIWEIRGLSSPLENKGILLVKTERI